MKFSSIKAIRSLVNLVYPQICVACDDQSPLKNKPYCLKCQQDLYYTDHVSVRKNSFEEMFFGRISVEQGASMFYYRKDTAIQELLFSLKYKGNRSIGIQLGEEFGHMLNDTDFMNGITAIVPVPMFWKKEKKRGYNPAYIFADGISSATKTPCYSDLLIKTMSTESQTRKSRTERLKNVENVFEINKKYDPTNEHILLVDDVLTTGATLEACAETLQKSGLKTSMVTLAIGRL